MAQYTCDPATDGYGLYVVLWFGEESAPPQSWPTPPRPPPSTLTAPAKPRVSAGTKWIRTHTVE